MLLGVTPVEFRQYKEPVHSVQKWSLICKFFDAWLAISANAKAMDRWPTVPLSLARALFCWPFLYCADVRSSSLTKYGWKSSVAESEVENQGLCKDRCTKAQLKKVITEKQRIPDSLWFKAWVCPSVSVGIQGFLEQVGGSPVGAVLPTVRGRERSDFCYH